MSVTPSSGFASPSNAGLPDAQPSEHARFQKPPEETPRDDDIASLIKTESTDTKLLQAISLEIIPERDSQVLYEKILDAAVAIMQSDFASMQMYCPERGQRGELRLLSFRGFTPEAAQFWEWVRIDSRCVCGEALRTRRRVIVPNIEECSFLAGTDHLVTYQQTGIGSVQTTPLLSRDGSLVGMISTHWRRAHHPSERDLGMLDILARQAADLIERNGAEKRERALMEDTLAVTAKFQAVFNQSGIFAGITDLQGCLREINDQALDACGYAREQVQDCVLWETPWWRGSEQTRSRVRAAIEQAATGRVFHETMRYWLADGAERLMDFTLYPIRDADGGVRFLHATGIDVTERKLAQQRAAELAAIVEHSDDAIFSLDLGGMIRSWNRGAERLYGYTAIEAVGQPVTILLPEGRRNETPDILERIRQGHPIENYETIRRRKDGTTLDVSLTVSPVIDEDGTIFGASKVARDITDKVRAKERLEQTVAERTTSLRQAVAQLEEFSYTVSHDLRAPLRGMKAYAEALLQDYAPQLPDEAVDYLRRISANVTRLDRMILDVLTFSRVSRTEINIERINVDRLVRQIVDEYHGLKSAGASIAVQPLHDVLGHEPSLTQALSNLLNNAVKFVAPGVRPKVAVLSERNDGYVRISITDNGIGVDPRYQARLFSMFERIHPDQPYDGTGVGLAIVRKAVERMGGRSGMESDGTNGSRFWIELRAAEEA